MPVTSEAFRQALSRFASGVTVVTTASGGQKAGLTVSAFSSLSLEPPYILVCIDKSSSSCAVLRSAGAFAVNILASDQAHLSQHFASRLEDKFAQVDYHPGLAGIPVLHGTLASLECRLVQELDGGDHFIYIGQVERTFVDESKSPLLYYRGQYRQLAEG
ncbi:flavin reductase [Alicyclobacillus cellulosilyticus]|uniref:Flavin reductase n=1 Tax=Alicyclobacillus cellulosilyticus TaxID=1003997 RepID=A0A917NLL0_9BACL|nr:flavin reductase family protein [Alicyclobacillus cellulosilyticus]GGJ09933.1 flavin reductase [Alicyclobacillus cellulosilyticus]